jgi:ABC-type proline/glycine betaine transport system permease subunit
MGIRMSVTLTIAVMAGAALICAQALADPMSHSVSNKHQLIACMTKRMSASRSVSYNDAAKLCKDQLKAQNSSVTPSAAVKPAG